MHENEKVELVVSLAAQARLGNLLGINHIDVLKNYRVQCGLRVQTEILNTQNRRRGAGLSLLSLLASPLFPLTNLILVATLDEAVQNLAG